MLVYLQQNVVHSSNFPSAQFYINNYEVKTRRDLGKNVGGLIEFVKKEFISKRLKNLESKANEVICFVFNISSRK